MAARFIPLTPHLGMEVVGAALSGGGSPALMTDVKSALLSHHVVVLREQADLTPEAFIAFAKNFGELEPFFISAYSHPAHPEIYILSNVRQGGRPIGRDGAGFHWHTDNSFVEKPTAMTLLHAIEVPAEGKGGDTLFANMHRAYDNLPEPLKQQIAGKCAIHRYQKKEFVFTGDAAVDGAEKERIAALQTLRAREAAAMAPSPSAQKHNSLPDRMQPIVRSHPVTGRKALYLNAEMMVGIAGEDPVESRELLRDLCRRAAEYESLLRVCWRKGDIVMWDNAAVMHTATYTDPAEPRTLHRLTIKGDVPQLA